VPAHRQQRIFYNRMDDCEEVGCAIMAASPLHVHLVTGISLPAVTTSYRLSLRFIPSKTFLQMQ